MRVGLGADSYLSLQAATASQCLNISRALTEQTNKTKKQKTKKKGGGEVACCFENVIIISYPFKSFFSLRGEPVGWGRWVGGG